MATTPPPFLDSARPSTPPAPRLGAYYDNWEPYSCRKSSRIMQRNGSPRKTSSPQSSSMKRPATHDQPDELLGKPTDPTASKKTTTKRNGTMLPTPTKTPRKAATTKQVAEMDAVKRNIFPSIDEESPFAIDRKSRPNKKITGQSLESFRIEEDDQDFPIFADSCNRVPEQDESNPFYNPAQPQQVRSTRKAKKVAVSGEGLVRVEDAAGRGDGMLMNFRGKTYFQRFSKPANADAENPDELAFDDHSLVHGVKPKLLFPKKQDKDELADDEEAETDVEDGVMDAEPATPKRTKTFKTPNAPRLPASPPATDEATRTLDFMPSTPAKKGKKTQSTLSTFKKSGWGTVSKAGKSSAGAKRSGPPLDNQAKRARTSDA